MERNEYKRHSRESKLEAVRLSVLGEKSKSQIARELGIHVNQLGNWWLDFEEKNAPARRTCRFSRKISRSCDVRMPGVGKENELLKSGYLLRAGIDMKHHFVTKNSSSYR